MVVLALFSIVLLALTSLFSAGFRLWHRLRLQQPTEQVALALIDLIEKREQVRPFGLSHAERVKENEWSFPGLSLKREPLELSEIRYWVDSNGILFRQEQAYGDGSKGQKEHVIELARGLAGLQVKNLFFNEWTGKFEDKPSLGRVSDELKETPDALEVALQYRTPDGKIRTLERIIRI